MWVSVYAEPFYLGPIAGPLILGNSQMASNRDQTAPEQRYIWRGCRADSSLGLIFSSGYGLKRSPKHKDPTKPGFRALPLKLGLGTRMSDPYVYRPSTTYHILY